MSEATASFEVRNAGLDDLPAQSLYASEGWVRDTAFVEFDRKL
jgi:hypothetical protein